MPIDVQLGEQNISSLKQELKEWEKAFASKNGGQKPGRDDIKSDATIAAKYKEYDRLRKKPAETKATPQKRRPRPEHDNVDALKERPANSITATPRRKAGHEDTKLLQVPVAAEEEPTPAAVRFALGPTPHKDGEVLGIFDALPTDSPSKGGKDLDIAPEIAVSATPSKRNASSSSGVPSRTPQSSGKRYLLGAFAGTPLKRKREDDEGTPSTMKRQWATPSFLRRNVPLATIDEEPNDGRTSAAPFKKRGLVRSLSSIIQGLRKQEEDTMDEEWDIMRELEEEEEGNAGQKRKPEVLAVDSQAIEMPLGPDQAPETSDDDSDVDPGSLDANGNPRKVWKKKGQKRTTKRVKMRPVLHKPKKATGKDETTDVVVEPEVAEETQLRDGPAVPDPVDSHDEGDGSNFEDEGELSDHEQATKKPKSKKDKAKSLDDEEEKKIRKPKKVSAQAHANFRKLKIKNKNSKANGRGRKFGRR